MTVEGRIEIGQIVLYHPTPLPEGMQVRVELLETQESVRETTETTPGAAPSLYERLKPFIGSVKGLPLDYAINHDHYLHGQPKQPSC